MEGGTEAPVKLTNEKVVGNGSFGVVYAATIAETGETVAVKRVLQDKRFKNRELQIMRSLRHPNVVELKHCFYSPGEKDDLYLNLVMEYVPETVYRVVKHYNKTQRAIPMIYIKVYMYQVARSLAYIHSQGICHRDIKPQNLLLDTSSHIVKLCDFGSAKPLVKGEPNIAYICSRYYRAPELIFGATSYTTAIDTWSFGCVFAEMILGQPIFPGESNVDQLVEIIKVVGTPTKEEIRMMNPNYTDFHFPAIKAHPWNKVFKQRATPEALDLIAKLLRYSPHQRITPMQALAHPFFDELRDPKTRLPGGKPLPPLFNFNEAEQKAAGDLMSRLVPPHSSGAVERNEAGGSYGGYGRR